MLTREQLQKLAERALSMTEFPECGISLSSTESAFLRFALNGVTTSGFVINQSLGISVTKDKKSGSTSVDDFDEKSIREAVRRAEQIAQLSPVNPEGVPPLPPQKYPAIDNFAETTAGARNPVMTPHVHAVIDASRSAGLVAAGVCADLETGVQRSAAAIDDGRAEAALERLVAVSCEAARRT